MAFALKPAITEATRRREMALGMEELRGGWRWECQLEWKCLGSGGRVGMHLRHLRAEVAEVFAVGAHHFLAGAEEVAPLEALRQGPDLGNLLRVEGHVAAPQGD